MYLPAWSPRAALFLLLSATASAACAPRPASTPSDAGASADTETEPDWYNHYDEADADVALIDVGPPDDPEPDAGLQDAGRSDAARLDAARSDSGSTTSGCGPQADSPSGAGTRTTLNSNPHYIQVLVNNIENLEEPSEQQCPGDWRNLIAYVRQMRPQPDLFLVQQISDRAQLDALTRALNDQLAGTYDSLIADPDPAPMVSPCGPPKAKQTNAIIYRTARFAPVGPKLTFQPISAHSGQCARSTQARSLYIVQKLHDRVADRDVTAVAMHWPTHSAECSQQSAAELEQRLRTPGYGADLVIVGGDANVTDTSSDGSFRAWYRLMNGDLGGAMNFRDAIYSRCQRTDAPRACLNDNWTCGGDNRIDYLFARRAGRCRTSTAQQHTVGYGEAKTHSGLNYSGHHAVHAEIYYE